jgi:hypothetical protein
MKNRSEKLYLAQRRKARQVRKNKKIFFFAPWRLGAINFLEVVLFNIEKLERKDRSNVIQGRK